MNTVTDLISGNTERLQGFQRLKLFFALSRTPHGMLDMATPGMAALLWLGKFPDVRTIGLGLLTVFSGYTAVYALNDIVDYKTDREKIRRGGFQDSGNYIDASIIRHPLAYGLLGFKEALFWALSWSILAFLGTWLLNPVCIVIFAAGCLMEVIYCKLWKISPLRILISGAVKTCGPVAAIFAVDPTPSGIPLAIFFLWLLFWEMGAQNIPNDWAEIDEDRLLEAKTLLVRYGASLAGRLAFLFLFVSTAIGLYIILHRSGPAPAVAALIAGFFLLLKPGFRLMVRKSRSVALVLFNLASYYPLTILSILTLDNLVL